MVTTGKDPRGDLDFRDDLITELTNHSVSYKSVTACFCDGNTGETKIANIKGINNTMYAIASLSKPMLGHLFADAITRAEVTETTTIGSLLGDLTGNFRNVQLKYLATHTGGLPSYPSGEQQHLDDNANYGYDPYPFTTAELYSQASSQYVNGNLGTENYSNMGGAILGQGLAAQAGLSYPNFITQRLWAPLGMNHTYLPVTQGGLRPDAAKGYSWDHSRFDDIWTMNGYCPAGGVQTNIIDYAKFIHSIMNSTCIGMAAINQHTVGDSTNNGWLWGRWTMGDSSIRLEYAGGMSNVNSYIGIDITNKKAISIISASGGANTDVVPPGQDLLVAYGGGS